MRNKLFWMRGLILIGLVCSHSFVSALPVYAQLSNTADQTATFDNVNQPIPIVLQTVNGISGMDWDGSNNRLMIKQDGVYVILSDIQAGARENEMNVIKGGDIYYWINLNQSPIPNTGSWVFASPQSRSKNIANVWISPLKAGDFLQFMFSSSAPAMGIIAKIAEKNYPSAPGVTISVFKLE